MGTGFLFLLLFIPEPKIYSVGIFFRGSFIREIYSEYKSGNIFGSLFFIISKPSFIVFLSSLPAPALLFFSEELPARRFVSIYCPAGNRWRPIFDRWSRAAAIDALGGLFVRSSWAPASTTWCWSWARMGAGLMVIRVTNRHDGRNALIGAVFSIIRSQPLTYPRPSGPRSRRWRRRPMWVQCVDP